MNINLQATLRELLHFNFDDTVTGSYIIFYIPFLKGKKIRSLLTAIYRCEFYSGRANLYHHLEAPVYQNQLRASFYPFQ